MNKLKKALSFLTALACAGSVFMGTSLSASAAEDGNDSFEDAVAVEYGTEYQGNIAEISDKDYYKVTLPESGKLTVSVESGVKEIQYHIYYEDVSAGEVTYKKIGKNSTTNLINDSTLFDLTGGTYYIIQSTTVNNSDYMGDYSISFDYESSSESFAETGTGTNNTIPSASVAELNTEYKGQIGVNDNIDYYKFTLEKSGRVNFPFISDMESVNVKIVQADNSTTLFNKTPYSADSSTNMINKNDSVDLTSGDYYFIVERYEFISTIYTGNYSFKLNYTSSEESFAESGTGTNNTILTASVAELDTEYKGQIAKNDNIDYYKFTLEKSGRVNFPFISDMERVNVKIVQADNSTTLFDGNQYFADSTTNMINKNDSVDLTSGDYYFIVEKYDGYTGNYSFNLNYTSAEESFAESGTGTNNSTLTASEVELNKVYNGQIAKNDSIDYYKFTLEESGRVTFPVNSKMTKLIVSILGSDGVTKVRDDFRYGVDSATNEINKNDSIDLIAGTYYFAVKPDGYTGNYDFALNFESAGESDPENAESRNNIITEASDVMKFGMDVTGQIAQNDEIDYYEFTTVEPHIVSWELTSDNMKNVRFYICDSNGKEINASGTGPLHADSTSGQLYAKNETKLEAGTYYVLVQKDDVTGNYTFSIDERPVYELGDVTRDNKVNIYDVIEIAKCMMGMVEFDTEQFTLGNVNGDDAVNIYDAIEIANTIM